MSKVKCPLVGEACWEHECAWYTQVQGMHPQTGVAMDQWDCAIAWLPMLTLETAKHERHTGAAVESFRNEMVKSNEAGLQAQLALAELHYARITKGNGSAPDRDALPPGDT